VKENEFYYMIVRNVIGMTGDEEIMKVNQVKPSSRLLDTGGPIILRLTLSDLSIVTDTPPMKLDLHFHTLNLAAYDADYLILNKFFLECLPE
jgi:hypothetical protein